MVLEDKTVPEVCLYNYNSMKLYNMHESIKETEDEKYMRRAIQLAKCGEGLTYPNPMVGAVIVRNGEIIGEGYHIKAGTGHAEVNAVNSVADKSLLRDATIYVSLEPCSHYGKTPPCAKLIIDMQIARIVVGCIDSFSEVSGRGIKMLRDAGREVVVGVLNDECRELNKRFFTYHEKHRPYVILKWAQSADGFIDRNRSAAEKASMITDEHSHRLVHKQRASEQAILVGGNTIRMDNPSLTTRSYAGTSPKRYVYSPSGNLAAEARVFNDGGETTVISDAATPEEILSRIYSDGMQSVIVEGGRQTLQTFIDAGIWDEAHIYTSQVLIGDGVKAPKICIDNMKIEESSVSSTCRLMVVRNIQQ